MKIEIIDPVMIIKSYNINYYQITNITIIPNLSAKLEILFFSIDNQIYSRNYTLENDEYSDWQTYGYLNEFIINNLNKIFNS